MSIYEQLRNVRGALKCEGKWCEVFFIEGRDLEGTERTWAVEVRSDDSDETLKAIARGIRRVSEVRVPVH
jgi:hypothetical protein